jgi:hypothetical protein
LLKIFSLQERAFYSFPLYCQLHLLTFICFFYFYLTRFSKIRLCRIFYASQ